MHKHIIEFSTFIMLFSFQSGEEEEKNVIKQSYSFSWRQFCFYILFFTPFLEMRQGKMNGCIMCLWSTSERIIVRGQSEHGLVLTISLSLHGLAGVNKLFFP